MSSAKPEIEWFTTPAMWDQYGLLCLAGKWAVVKAEPLFANEDFKVITDWVDDRKTAIGFLKLLKEN